MINKFPHLKNSTPFPTTDINVYKYRNEFDYTRYTGNVSIKLCVVPWCGDYDNVVKFTNDSARDAYIDALDGTELETMFNLLPQTSIKVPLPATNMQLYNYCVVDLPVMAPPDNPVEYADEPRIERYLYFIGDVRQNSTNASECDLTLDVWATYINHVEFSYVMLERGHAPMAEVNVSEYLKAPAEHSRYLTAPDDVIEDAPTEVTDTKVINFTGGEMWYAIATNADVESELWGAIDSATASTPAVAQMAAYTTQGLPTPRVYAIDIEDIEGFYVAVEEQRPQFMATVKATFFIEKELAVKNETALYPTVEFCGFTLTRLTANQHIMNMLDVSEATFDFPEPYNKIAKLYTYPYSYIRISHEDGESSIVRIENLTDILQIRVCAQITFPYLSIDTHLLNIGGVDESMTFNKESEGWTFRYGGHFAQYYKKHNIPCFYVVQDSKAHATWAYLYDRIQAKLAANNALDSAITTASNVYAANQAVALANYNNSLAAASTARTNTYNIQDVILDNLELTIAKNDTFADYQIDWNTQKCDFSNDIANREYTLNQTILSANYDANMAGASTQLANAQITYDAASSANSSNALGTIAAGTIGGLAMGSVAIPGVGSVSGAAVGFLASTASALASSTATETTIAAQLETANNTYYTSISNISNVFATTSEINQIRLTDGSNQWGGGNGIVPAQNRFNNEMYELEIDTTNRLNNDLNEATTNNTTDCAKTNADNVYTTETANAERTYNAALTAASNSYNAAINAANNDYDTAINAIENTFKQQCLETPYEYGTTSNGEYAASRPIATWAQVITQNEGAIRYAGDAFLRYGYRLNQQWHITKLQVMPYYTYWKCSEIWCAGEQTVLEGTQNIIKAIMEQGVTIWDNPDNIGKVSIYDNI